MMTVVASGDHRYGDAAIWVPMFNAIKSFMNDPVNFDEKKIKGNMHYLEQEANAKNN